MRRRFYANAKNDAEEGATFAGCVGGGGTLQAVSSPRSCGYRLCIVHSSEFLLSLGSGTDRDGYGYVGGEEGKGKIGIAISRGEALSRRRSLQGD